MSRYRGDVLLSSTGRYVITVVNDEYSLTIKDIESSDAGQYTVKAISDKGECRCTATLAIKGSTCFYLEAERYLLSANVYVETWPWLTLLPIVYSER